MLIPKLLLFALPLWFAAAWAESMREVHYQGALAPIGNGPSFDHGYLVSYDGATAFSVYSADGSLRYAGQPQIPDAVWALAQNGAADSDGSAALAVAYRTGKHSPEQGKIALFDREGKQTRLIGTGDFVATQVCFAGDHSIWAVGRIPARSVPDDTGEYFILRHYSREGAERGAYLPRSSFRSDAEPIEPIHGMWGLRQSKDRMGIFVFSTSPAASAWVETDLEGKELGRWKVPSDFHPLAFTTNGRVYGITESEIRELDHGSGEWKLSRVAKPDGFVLGADGDLLVIKIKGANALRWIAQP